MKIIVKCPVTYFYICFQAEIIQGLLHSWLEKHMKKPEAFSLIHGWTCDWTFFCKFLRAYTGRGLTSLLTNEIPVVEESQNSRIHPWFKWVELKELKL